MSSTAVRVVAALLTPPGSLLALAALGLLLSRWKRRAGLNLAVGAGLLLALLACPYVGGNLLASLQRDPALPSPGSGRELPRDVQAIVVLAAGDNALAPEYGVDTVDAVTLERLRYAAALARRTGLPVLTSGGAPRRHRPALAEMMRDVLREWGVEARWTEPFSANTRGNAQASAQILFAAGVERVYLVTHAWHMPRAAATFRSAGLDVVPAPTGFRSPPRLDLPSFWPSARGLHDSAWAFHEWVGRAWYALSGS